MRFLFYFLYSLIYAVSSSDVVVLSNENFEHDTQASTGATTGDWLIEFYAPWCGHCKSLAPIWETLATNLKGDINVAKVDVTANAKLGSRFKIEGFPTILFFSKGKYFTFQGRRSATQISEFAKGGYKQVEGLPVPPTPTFFDEITSGFTDVIKKALKDIEKKRYFTTNVLLLTLPFVFLVFAIILFFVIPPDEDIPDTTKAIKGDAKKEE